MCQRIFTSLNAIWLLVKMLCNQACAGFPAALRVKCISAVALRSYAVMRTGVGWPRAVPSNGLVWYAGLAQLCARAPQACSGGRAGAEYKRIFGLKCWSGQCFWTHYMVPIFISKHGFASAYPRSRSKWVHLPEGGEHHFFWKPPKKFRKKTLNTKNNTVPCIFCRKKNRTF